MYQNIKRTILAICITMLTIAAMAQCVQPSEFIFSFDEHAYGFYLTEEGKSYIAKDSSNAVISAESSSGLPIEIQCLMLPFGMDVAGVDVAVSERRIIREGIELTDAPMTGQTTSERPDTTMHEPCSAILASYPDYCTLSDTYTIFGVPMVNINLTPFEYDANEKTLYFIDEIRVRINYQPTETPNIVPGDVISIGNILKSIVINPEDVDDVLSYMPSMVSDYPEPLEYLIITTGELAEPFVRLVNWKKLKGVHASIVTLDQISSWYSQCGSDMVEHIKWCIYDLYMHRGLKYVVLGGDADAIPSRKCYAYFSNEYNYIDEAVDLYYVCFGGNFEWNANGNEMYGEKDDGIDLAQSVYISRIPVHTTEEASAYIDKLLKYEEGKNPEKWTESILTAGARLYTSYKAIEDGARSDVDKNGDIDYNKYIADYWTGNRVRFYDTGTDFPGDADYDVNRDNLVDVLGNGYMFVSMSTHGGKENWSLETHHEGIGDYRVSRAEGYTQSDALSQTNTGYTVISSIGCVTAGFDYDYKDISLAEGFIRGKDNGVVAYLGYAREGSATNSRYYEGEFFKALFSDDSEIESGDYKNFGKLLALSKVPYLSSANSSSTFTKDRFLQYGLYAIGDAETPIYRYRPKTFDDVTFRISGNGIDISTGVDGCRICIMDLDEEGYGYYVVRENTNTLSVSMLPYRYSVAITKQDYKPFIYGFNRIGVSSLMHGVLDNRDGLSSITYPAYLSIEDEDIEKTIVPYIREEDKRDAIVNCGYNRSKDSIDITLQLQSELSDDYYIIVCDIYGNVISKVRPSNTYESISTSEYVSGVYVVALEEGGDVIDSKKIVK